MLISRMLNVGPNVDRSLSGFERRAHRDLRAARLCVASLCAAAAVSIPEMAVAQTRGVPTTRVAAAATSAPDRTPRPRIGLVLSGGGARGYADLGVLRVLEENHIPVVDYVAGTSMGAASRSNRYRYLLASNAFDSDRR